MKWTEATGLFEEMWYVEILIDSLSKLERIYNSHYENGVLAMFTS